MFSAKEESLHQVFTEKRYAIPFYQRPYSWLTDNAETLWDDIFECWKEGTNENIGYFLGSIVLVSKEKNGRDDIVDGQQRFITIQLLISAIAQNILNEDAKRKLSKYFMSEENEFAGTKSELVVEPGKRYKFIYEKVITGNGANLKSDKSATRFYENYNLFQEKAQALEQIELVEFGKFILRQCHLAVLRADSDVKALRIFSVLNDRGIDLHPVDILKASILEKIKLGDDQKQNYAEKWEEYEEQFDRPRFQDLITHIRMTYVRSRTQIPLHEDILRRVSTAHAAEQFLKSELPNFSNAFESLLSSDDILIQNIREIGKRAGFKDWEAPTIFLLKERKPDTNYQHIIKKITSIIAMMAITRMTDGQRAGRFGKIIEDIESYINKTKKLSELASLRVSKNEWDTFERNLRGDAYACRGLKAGLLWLESISGDSERSLSSGEITVEHLLPRSLGSEPYWRERFTEETWSESANKVGNLLLVSGRSNSKLARKSFIDKKSYLDKKGGSPWIWTQNALQHEDWNISSIKKREDEIIEVARKYFEVNI